MNEFIEIKGKEYGPISVILAGVHGNEVCGVNAFKKIIPTLTIERGKVTFIYANPKAIELSVRFIDANLNRMFKNDEFLTDQQKLSYEYKQAQFLKKFLDGADVLLDIHASTTKGSPPFIICEPNSFSITQYLPVHNIVSGFDDVEPGGTDYYMNRIGKIGICMECGFLGDESSEIVARNGIFAFLIARGHIPGNLKVNSQTYIRMHSLYLTSTDNFTLSKSFSDFEKITKGQVIGKDGEKEVVADRESIILFARNRNFKGAEAFLLGEEKSSLA